MGDMANYIAMAIPVFFLLIAIELWWAKREAREVARFNDSIVDISTGSIQQILGLFVQATLFAVYGLLYQNWRFFEMPATAAWSWVVCFLGVDFCYYWFHRFSHESNFAWAAHVVHHQSEDYNLSVALRQSALQQFISTPFYWPLALLGFPPPMFLALSAANTLYQFWIHTEAIGRLGPLEWVLNTPSHHRVHHGSNPQYIDRNHGGTLIVWDRLFGTFEPEMEKVAYGVTQPPKSWNPLWVNAHQWVELWKLSRRAPRLRDKVQLWFREPGWLPEGVSEAPKTDNALHGVKYDARAPKRLERYVAAHFALLMIVSFFYIMRFEDLSFGWRLLVGGFQVWSVVSFGGVFELRRWLPVTETARLLLGAALLVAAMLSGAGAVPVAVPAEGVSPGPVLGSAPIAGLAIAAFGSVVAAYSCWIVWSHRREFRTAS